jgi:uncharacterized membrane protein YGL010W
VGFTRRTASAYDARVNPKLRRLFAEYAEGHRHPTNRLTHKIAIPLIFFHLLAALDWIQFGMIPGTDWALTAGRMAFVGICGWYIAMSVRLGILLTVAFSLAFVFGPMTPGWLLWVLGVAGWGIQMAGHAVWERNSPSFANNLIQLLVGPVFFVALVTGDWKLDSEPRTA